MKERSGLKVIWGDKYYDEMRNICSENDDTYVAMSSSTSGSASAVASGGPAQPVAPALMQAISKIHYKTEYSQHLNTRLGDPHVKFIVCFILGSLYVDSMFHSILCFI